MTRCLSVVALSLFMAGAVGCGAGGGSTDKPSGTGGIGGPSGTGGSSSTPPGGSGGSSGSGGAGPSSSTGGSDGGTGPSPVEPAMDAGGLGGADGSSDATDGGGDAGETGDSASGPYGIVSCQPAFEVACKPAIKFTNGDPNGRGKVFTNVITDVTATLKDIACTTCSILYRTPDEIPQNERPATITLVLDTFGGVAQTYPATATIEFDLDYINTWAKQSPALVKQEMLGVLQHESVHIYQNYGNNGTGEGEADLVRTRVGYYQRNRWQKGGSWKDPYTNSGFFYSWLTGPCSFHAENYPQHDFNFPYKLNKALAGTSGDASYTAVDNLLRQLFAKGADELWQQYQDTAF
ncbi:MAG TPA: basic secretory protein-like protein [Polyangia bacterium]|nr:basic secretory protein-like protein [Polyangia bacterium]